MLTSEVHVLPRWFTSFVGREREVAEVSSLITSTPLITLTGPAGCGKTRLAFEVAAGAATAFGERISWVDVAPVTDPELIPLAIAAALGLRDIPGKPPTDAVAEYLGAESALLIIDNCEHAMDAVGRLIAALLSRCPHLRILATSRIRLPVQGERAYVLSGLPFPNPSHVPSVDRLPDHAAVKLFLDRAAAARPGFELAAPGASAVVKVCAALDGLPLAIELAAARVKILSPEQILARLDDRFRLLRTGGPESGRHESLQAALDVSYDLLAEPDRRVFRALSVFAGGSTMQTVEGVCDDTTDQVLDILSHLVDHSVIRIEEQHGEARYQVLESIREYGRAKLDAAAEADLIRRRHVAVFLELAEAADRQFAVAVQESWLKRLEAEHDNFRAALRFSAAQVDLFESHLRLAGALSRFWYLRGHLSEGRLWLRRALAHAPNAAPAERAKALDGLARLALVQEDLAEAETLWDQALALSRNLRDRSRAALALHGLGVVACHHGDYPRAIMLYEESLAMRRAIDDALGVGTTLNALGTIMQKTGEYARAEALYAESLSVMRPLNDKMGIAYPTLNLASVLLEQGEHEGAIPYLREGLALLWDIRHIPVIPEGLESWANAVAAFGQPERAAEFFGVAEKLREAIGSPVQGDERRNYELLVAKIRGRTDPDTWAAAWAKGRETPLEHVMEQVISGDLTPRPAILRIHLLGGLEVLRGDMRIPSTAWRRRKDRLLLAYLLVARTPVPRDTLLGALWPDLPPGPAGASLNVAWSNLKRGLEPHLAEGVPSSYLVIDGRRYGIRWELISTDMQDFEARVAAANVATLKARVSALEAAVALYRGDLLSEDVNEPWTVLERERLRTRYLEVLEQLADGQLQEGRTKEALETLRTILRLEPWREETYRSLMKVLVKLGHRSEALRAYRECEILLERELGVAPSSETVALFEAITSGEVVR